MTETVLCLNAGSSSVKFQLFEAGTRDELSLVFKGQIEGIGAKPRLTARDAAGRQLIDRSFAPQDVTDVGAAVPRLTDWLHQHLEGELPIAIGHRLVFGGTRYAAPALIDDEVYAYLRSLIPLMPLHLPVELAPVEAIRKSLPDIPQIGVFDTAFHRGHAEVIQRLPIPEDLHREGVLSYGYHGISYEFIAQRLKEIAPDLARGRVVVGHLGNGCSMCALVAGKSVDSSWGFSGLDGLPMGTRPGRLDPGVVLYLFQIKGISVQQVEHLLYHECGLKGISGISNDVRELLASQDARARLALDSFSLSCARTVAALDRDGRHRRARLHRRHRRERRTRPGEHLLEAGLAWSRDRRGRERPARAADLHGQERHHLLRRTDQ